MLKYFAVLAFVTVVSGSTNVQRCQVYSGALPSFTTIEGCRNTPCDLPQGRNAVIHMTFNSPRNINSMRTLATAFLGSLRVPYPLGSNEITCNSITNTRCPVTRGQLVHYTLRFMIERSFPVGTSTTVEFRIVDQSNGAVVCVRAPIRITSPRTVAAPDMTEQIDNLPY